MKDKEGELPAEELRSDRQKEILVREAAEAKRGEDSRDRLSASPPDRRE